MTTGYNCPTCGRAVKFYGNAYGEALCHENQLKCLECKKQEEIELAYRVGRDPTVREADKALWRQYLVTRGLDPDAVDRPDRPGIWRDQDGELLEIYPLEPVGGILCYWDGDYRGGLTQNNFWTTDEWLGHVPVTFLDGHWTFVSEE
jgi:hypothetical protein